VALLVAAMVAATVYAADDGAYSSACSNVASNQAIVNGSLTAAILAVALCLAWRLREVTDQLCIKLELRVGVVLLLTGALGEGLFTALQGSYDESSSPLRRLWVLVFTLAFLVSIFALPLRAAAPRGRRIRAVAACGGPLHTIDGVLSDDVARCFFLEFLTLSLCPEPLLFWEDVELLRAVELACGAAQGHTCPPLPRGSMAMLPIFSAQEMAVALYKRYVAPDAPILLNLPSNIAATLRREFAFAAGGCTCGEAPPPPQCESAHMRAAVYKPPQGWAKLFEAAQRDAYTLLATDPFPRFARSDIFRKMLTAVRHRDAELKAVVVG
jgi:hypothetical protein